MGSADRPLPGRRRSTARLAAVQALYEMDVAGAAADPVLGEFIGQRWKRPVEDEPELSDLDESFLSGLVRGAASRTGELDALIAPALSKDWSLDRLEVLLRSILRAGAFELLALDTPTKVVITEYLDVAHSFFSGNEPALVNAVLDRVAVAARAPDAGNNGDGRSASGGEFDLIARHFAPLARGETGALGLTDDAAVLAIPEGQALVVTTDTMVAGVHFLEHMPAEAVGARLLRVNLSDLASMGAMPAAYTVSLSFPRYLAAAERDDWAAGFAGGLAADQNEFGLTLVGGDTVSAPGPMSLTLTALGWIEPGRELRRSGARAGDRVYASGTIGDAALGLEAERGGLRALASAYRTELIGRFHRPTPRIQTGLRLVGVAHAAVDVSDGLVGDLGHICEASNLSAQLDAASVPLSSAARAALAADTALIDSVLTGGDDYELVFTAPAAAHRAIDAIAVETGVPLTAIGAMTELAKGAQSRVRVIGSDGKDIDLAISGFRHF